MTNSVRSDERKKTKPVSPKSVRVRVLRKDRNGWKKEARR